jgi:hypothetical protein
MPEQTDRPQDVGSDHRRRGSPSAETLAVLADYRAALRVELMSAVAELRELTGSADLDRRAQLVGLAVKVARELATGSDATGAPAATLTATRGKAPKLTRRDRAALEA